MLRSFRCVSARVMHDELLLFDECAHCYFVSLHIVCLLTCSALASELLLLTCRVVKTKCGDQARHFAAETAESAEAKLAQLYKLIPAGSPTWKQVMGIAGLAWTGTIFINQWDLNNMRDRLENAMTKDKLDLEKSMTKDKEDLKKDIGKVQKDTASIRTSVRGIEDALDGKKVRWRTL